MNYLSTNQRKIFIKKLNILCHNLKVDNRASASTQLYLQVLDFEN